MDVFQVAHAFYANNISLKLVKESTSPDIVDHDIILTSKVAAQVSAASDEIMITAKLKDGSIKFFPARTLAEIDRIKADIVGAKAAARAKAIH